MRPAGFEEVETAEIARAFASLLYVRLLSLPLLVGLTLWYWRSTGRGIVWLGGLIVFYAAIAVYLTLLFISRRRQPRLGMPIGLIGSIAITLITCCLSGGLGSPYILVIPVTVTTLAMAAVRRYTLIGTAITVGSLPVMALLGGTRPLLTMSVLLIGVAIGTHVGAAVRRMFEQMLVRVLDARDEMLRLHAEQMATLTALSGEIANELHTPLASIKGLSGLALVELNEPARAAERLEVLRSETLRMQRILEEFLNFSRPLSPLSLKSVDARQLCHEVADLYQGPARERRLVIAVEGEAPPLVCDPRKIRQVIINLVQNAVEASEPGGEIRLRVESGRIRVLDRGRGLAAALGQRAFEAGVTTKDGGSGLGLTIARSIAEQHGGTLVLEARAGGGCSAELVLPASGKDERRAA